MSEEDEHLDEVEEYIKLSDSEDNGGAQIEQQENLRTNMQQVNLQQQSLEDIRQQIQQQKEEDIFTSDEKVSQSSNNDSPLYSSEDDSKKNESPVYSAFPQATTSQSLYLESAKERSGTPTFGERRQSPNTQERILSLNQRRIARAQEEREKYKRVSPERDHRDRRHEDRHRSRSRGRSRSHLLEYLRAEKDDEEYEHERERRHRSKSRYESEHERSKYQSDYERSKYQSDYERRKYQSDFERSKWDHRRGRSPHYYSEHESSRRRHRSRGRYESDYEHARRKSRSRYEQESDDSCRRKQSPSRPPQVPQDSPPAKKLPDAMEFLKKAKQSKEGRPPPPPPLAIAEPPPPPPPAEKHHFSPLGAIQSLVPLSSLAEYSPKSNYTINLQQSDAVQPPPPPQPQYHPPPPPLSPKRSEKDNAQFINNQTPPASPLLVPQLSPRNVESSLGLAMLLQTKKRMTEGKQIQGVSPSKAGKSTDPESSSPQQKQKFGPYTDTWSGARNSKRTTFSKGFKIRPQIPKQDQLLYIGLLRVVYKQYGQFCEASFAKYGILNESYNSQDEFQQLKVQLQQIQQKREWLMGRLVRFQTEVIGSWTGTVYLMQAPERNCRDEVMDSLESPVFRRQKESNFGLLFELNSEVSYLAMAPYKFMELFGDKTQQGKGFVPDLEKMCLQSKAEYENCVLLAIQTSTPLARNCPTYAEQNLTLEDFLNI